MCFVLLGKSFNLVPRDILLGGVLGGVLRESFAEGRPLYDCSRSLVRIIGSKSDLILSHVSARAALCQWFGSLFSGEIF